MTEILNRYCQELYLIKEKLRAMKLLLDQNSKKIINNSLKHFSVFAYFLIKLCNDDILI